MPTTPNNHLPYPVLTDTADVPRDIKALADALDAILTAPPGGAGGSTLQLPVLDVGMVNQHRAGRQLTAQDFTGRGLQAPLGLWNLSDTQDSSGNNRHLTNKTSVPFGTGINGQANTAAVFSGATNQALYIPDDASGTLPGAAFRIRTGSWGCWLRTAKRGTVQYVLAKTGATNAVSAYALLVTAANVLSLVTSDGTTAPAVAGVTDVADDRWHFGVATFDGTIARLYLDGILEATGPATALNMSATAPVNIGAYAADSGTNVPVPGSHYGRVDEAFVTADVLTEDQIRGLYAAKIAHGYTLPPGSVTVNVRRRRRGGTLTTADFPAQPLRLHNFTAGSLADEGANAQALTNNGAAVSVAGADGAPGNAYSYAGAQSLSATDAGLPSGTAARSYGCWFKTTASAGTMIAYGTQGTADARAGIGAGGTLFVSSGGDQMNGPYITDGQWHQLVVVEDNAAGDGVRRKGYLDGRLVTGSTVLTSLTLAGANRFRVGANADGTSPFTGQIDGAFVCGYALTFEQVAALYAKGSQALPPSPKNSGDHVEAIDATSLLVIFDTLDTQHTVDLGVTG